MLCVRENQTKILVGVCVRTGFSEALLFADSVSTKIRERSGSVVECLTRDRGAAGLSLTGVTVLCP